MSPRLSAALEKIRFLSERFTFQNLPLRQLLRRACSDNPDQSTSAIHRIAREHDPELAALAWSQFWAREGDLFQARRELESIQGSNRKNTLWGGLAMMALGELLIELGESDEGLKLLGRAQDILGEPPLEWPQHERSRF